MIANSGLGTIRFIEPQLLWLQVFPLAALFIWLWRLKRYRGEARQFRLLRLRPHDGSLPFFGELLFWLVMTVSCSLVIFALCRPSLAGPATAQSGVDLIILQDGSASMSVRDVPGNRWQRSMRFLRVLGDSLEWKDDRIALAVFAHIAAPQVRLTKDPNTFFFFLDHLEEQSPFRLEDDTTWDTNIEFGIHWGIRIYDKDREIHGRSSNVPAFVLISDGQAWSGKVENAIKDAQNHHIQTYVIGVGTASGGVIPAPVKVLGSDEDRPIYSSLDRQSLLEIARTGNGSYMELDRESDRDIAAQIIRLTRKRVDVSSNAQAAEEVYWLVLLSAACVAGIGILALRYRSESLLFALAGVGSFAVLWLLTK